MAVHMQPPCSATQENGFLIFLLKTYCFCWVSCKFTGFHLQPNCNKNHIMIRKPCT